MKNSKWTEGAMLAGIITAVVGSLCCVGPLILIALGLGGAWIGAFGKFHLIYPYAIMATMLFLGFAFWRLYIQPQGCQEDGVCPIPKSLKIQRIVFWIVLLLAVLLLTFPYYGQWLI